MSAWHGDGSTGERNVVVAVEAAEHEEEAEVTGRGLGRCGREDEAEHAHAEWHVEVQAPLRLALRRPRDEETHDGRKEVGWSGHDEREDLDEAEGGDDGRDKLSFATAALVTPPHPTHSLARQAQPPLGHCRRLGEVKREGRENVPELAGGAPENRARLRGLVGVGLMNMVGLVRSPGVGGFVASLRCGGGACSEAIVR